jgi:hypothetical protein
MSSSLSKSKSNRSRVNRSSKRNNNGIYRRLMSLGMDGTSSFDHVITADLTNKPVSPYYRSRPPSNMLSQVYYVRQNTNFIVSTSTTVNLESNLAFSASADLLQSAAYLSIFDQFYLDSVVVTIANANTNAGLLALPEVFTAIDYDSIANISTIAAITAYQSCNTTIL